VQIALLERLERLVQVGSTSGTTTAPYGTTTTPGDTTGTTTAPDATTGTTTAPDATTTTPSDTTGQPLTLEFVLKHAIAIPGAG
jgi:hypothetical protein